MATQVTYAAALSKVQKELDMEGEEFVQPTEWLEYFNDALREAEAEILGIYADYFLDLFSLPLVQGQSLYALPPGIYAHKIRSMIYASGSIIYPIRRIRTSTKFQDRAEILLANPTDEYRYIIRNSATNGVQLELIPAAKETSSQNVQIWHLRTCNVVALTTDILDLPEFVNFIYAFVKYRAQTKENAGEAPQGIVSELEHERKLMVETLTDMVPDDDNEIEKDMSIYEEMS